MGDNKYTLLLENLSQKEGDKKSLLQRGRDVEAGGSREQ